MATRQHSSRPLRAIREGKGLTLTEVAQKAEVDPGHLSRAERGIERLSLRSLSRVGRVLGLNDLVRRLAPYVE